MKRGTPYSARRNYNPFYFPHEGATINGRAYKRKERRSAFPQSRETANYGISRGGKKSSPLEKIEKREGV